MSGLNPLGHDLTQPDPTVTQFAPQLDRFASIRTTEELITALEKSNDSAVSEIFSDDNIKMLGEISNNSEKLSLISILLRMNLPLKKRTASQTSIIDKVNGFVSDKGGKIVPVLQENILFDEVVEEMLSAIFPKDDEVSGKSKDGSSSSNKISQIKNNISKTADEMKKKPWDKTKPRFEERRLRGRTVKIVSRAVVENQPQIAYGGNSAALSGGEFRPIEDLDIDHMDPWSKIAGRVIEFLSFTDKLTAQHRLIIHAQLEKEYPDCFMKEGDSLVATQYLQKCLYHYPSNLSALAHRDNTQKNNQEAVGWLNSTCGLELFNMVRIGTHDVNNPDEVLDKTGFIIVVSSDKNMIESDFLGKGLATIYTEYEKRRLQRILPGLQNIRVLYQKVIHLSQLLELVKGTEVGDSERQQLNERFNHAVEKMLKKQQKYCHEVIDDLNELLVSVGKPVQSKSPARSQTSSEQALVVKIAEKKLQLQLMRKKIEQSENAVSDKNAEIADLKAQIAQLQNPHTVANSEVKNKES